MAVDQPQDGSVEDTHECYDEFASRWQRCRDCVDGEDAIKAAGELYLSKLTDESDDDYAQRQELTRVYDVADRTLDALVGALLRKPGASMLPPSVEEHQQNIDLAGTPYEGFKRYIGSEMLEVGRFGVMSDWSVEQARPFWRPYDTEDIRNWSYRIIKGQMILDQVVLRETVIRRASSGFGMVSEPQYRVVELNEQDEMVVRIFELDSAQSSNTKNVFIERPGGTPNRQGVMWNEIPFVCFGRADLRLEPWKPPIISICNLQLDHYRLDADLKWTLHLSVPTLFVIGDNPDQKVYKLGGLSANKLDLGADAKFVEAQGTMVDQLRLEKESDEQRAALLGARMLLAPKRVGETAEALTIQREGETASLTHISYAMSLGLTKLWQFHVRWMGGNPEDVQEDLNRDFTGTQLTPDEIRANLETHTAGLMSTETFLELLFAGGRLPHDAETEQERIAVEGPRVNPDGSSVDGSAPVEDGAVADVPADEVA